MTKIALPLLATPRPETQAPTWHDFSVATLPPASDAPEPEAPQGDYNPLAAESPLTVPLVDGETTRPVELLAPAGGIDAAFAAFHYGADAIYLGLKKFSARAEAENFTLAELDEITAYAHSLQPRRRVFVTINTLIRQDELPELIETLVHLSDLGVDAVILQDLGVYWAIRRYFPDLELHASTQMAVHNRAGAEILKKLGFSRVVLARELTFEEVRDITSTSGVETEVFIHGALCYSYSGLCLFSAQTLGRSGNRGKCAYSCRDSFEVSGAPMELRDGSAVRRDPQHGFPFSMKDLALPDHIPALRAAGVSCFKIEGRKKSPLYVATTTDYYRKLLEGKLAEDQRESLEEDLHTVFSRPWTRLFVQSHKDKEVADRDTVGHRGARIGTIEAIVGSGPLPHGRGSVWNQNRDHPSRDRKGAARIRFHAGRALQVHDGLQIDLPSQGTPFGFSVDKLWIVTPRKTRRAELRERPGDDRREVYEAPAGSLVEVPLPDDYPQLPLGAPVYCSSSQAVKHAYRFARPKPGLHRVRKPLDVHVALMPESLTVEVSTDSGRSRSRLALAGDFAAAQDVEAMDRAVRSAFSRLGPSAFTLNSLHFDNQQRCFVPVSRLNQLRRDVIDDLEKRQAEQTTQRIGSLLEECGSQVGQDSDPDVGFNWSIKVDRIDYLDAFTDEDWAGIDEVVIDIARDHPSLLIDSLGPLEKKLGKARLRLALPPLTRKWEEKGLLHKIAVLRAAGWNKWEAGNMSAWSYLGISPAAGAPGWSAAIDMATDWSVYVINRLAARQLLEMGVRRFALSPEDGLDNLCSLLQEFGSRAVVIVHQDTPLFLAESCAYANLIGGCPGKANCKFESMEMVSSHGEKVTALDYHCRTIVLNQGPFCLSTRLHDLARAGAVSVRADFVYRPYRAEEVRERWRQVRAGQPVPGGHFANFDRGIQ